MAVYTVIAHQRLDDYAVVQTLTDTPIEPGQSITLAGLGHGLNGTHTVLFCPQYEYIGTDAGTGEWQYDGSNPRANQVLFYDAGDPLDWSTAVPTGTLTWTQTCTWINATDIQTYVGITVATAGETTYLTQCAAAANAFCYRRRVEAGYLQDSLTTSPSGDVTLGTIMYGAALYRQRGSIDQFASFDAMSTAQIVGLAPIVKQLLGIDRPQVA
jgi:hypothetical protein